VIRWGQKVQTVIWTLPGILLPLSVVYFPLANLPNYIKPISYLIPTTYIFESMRTLLAGGTVNGNFILISLGLNVVYLILTLWWFVKSFRRSLELGLARFS
jgi:ABC-2 type transport system permease protein